MSAILTEAAVVVPSLERGEAPVVTTRAGVREVVFKTDAVDQFCEIVARLVNPAAGA